MKKIRILIADDQSLMRDGLRTILENEEDIEVVATAKNGLEAYQLTEKLNPHIVLMDIRMPKLNGVESTKKIKTKFPNVKVLALTTFDDEEYIIDILKYGADGYLLKDIGAKKLIKSIHDAINGDLLMSSKIAIKLAESVVMKKREDNNNEKNKNNISDLRYKHNLSNREEDIAIMLSQGFTNKQIASALYISHGTVKNYVSTIYSKIGISDRTKVAIYIKELVSS